MMISPMGNVCRRGSCISRSLRELRKEASFVSYTHRICSSLGDGLHIQPVDVSYEIIR